MGSEEDHEERRAKKVERGEVTIRLVSYENRAMKAGQLELRAARVAHGKLYLPVVDREVG